MLRKAILLECWSDTIEWIKKKVASVEQPSEGFQKYHENARRSGLAGALWDKVWVSFSSTFRTILQRFSILSRGNIIVLLFSEFDTMKMMSKNEIASIVIRNFLRDSSSIQWVAMWIKSRWGLKSVLLIRWFHLQNWAVRGLRRLELVVARLAQSLLPIPGFD